MTSMRRGDLPSALAVEGLTVSRVEGLDVSRVEGLDVSRVKCMDVPLQLCVLVDGSGLSPKAKDSDRVGLERGATSKSEKMEKWDL